MLIFRLVVIGVALFNRDQEIQLLGVCVYSCFQAKWLRLGQEKMNQSYCYLKLF